MGNTELKTVCRPTSSRSLGNRSICRNRSYDFFCTSIRFGIGIEVLILEKSTLSGAPAACARLVICQKTPEGKRQRNGQRPGSYPAAQPYGNNKTGGRCGSP